MIEPRYQSATKRRDLRRRVRGMLGTSSAAAPDAVDAVGAASAMIELVDLAASGRVQLRLWDPRAQVWLTPAEARKIVREG